MKCPQCDKPLKAIKVADGSTRYHCDCAGFVRTVVHVVPEPETAPAAPAPKEK